MAFGIWKLGHAPIPFPTSLCRHVATSPCLRMLTFPSHVPAITNSNPFPCNPRFPWLNILLPVRTSQFTIFTFVSPCFHDFHAKKISATFHYRESANQRAFKHTDSTKKHIASPMPFPVPPAESGQVFLRKYLQRLPSALQRIQLNSCETTTSLSSPNTLSLQKNTLLPPSLQTRNRGSTFLLPLTTHHSIFSPCAVSRQIRSSL